MVDVLLSGDRSEGRLSMGQVTRRLVLLAQVVRGGLDVPSRPLTV